jgi:plasmid stabilization system protein ParE
MSRPLVVRRGARLDARRAASWYDDQRPGLGSDFLVELGEFLKRIAEGPAQFPLMTGSVRRALLRRFPYSVYFSVGPQDEIVIVAILHQRRHPDIWKDRVTRD